VVGAETHRRPPGGEDEKRDGAEDGEGVDPTLTVAVERVAGPGDRAERGRVGELAAGDHRGADRRPAGSDLVETE
jgi:hypothetical protein